MVSLAEAFLAALQADPARVAVHEPDGRVTRYGALRRQVALLAGDLAAGGLAPGERVVLQAPGGAPFAAAALAVLLRGGVPVLAEPGLGDAVYRGRVAAAEARWLLVHPLVRRVGRVPGLRAALRRLEVHVPPQPAGLKTLVLDPERLSRRAAALTDREVEARLVPVPRAATDEAVLIFTGGTTSAPKGVRLPQGALLRYLQNVASVVEDRPLERFLADTPQQVLYAIFLQKTAYPTRGRSRRRAAHVLSLVREGAVDAYFGAPWIWVEMLRQAGPDAPRLPASLHTVLLGSAPVTPGFLERLSGWLHPDTVVRCLYGLTEAGPVCSATVSEKLAFGAGGELGSAGDLVGAGVPAPAGDLVGAGVPASAGDLVGAPLPGTRVVIDAPDESGVGEVLVHSEALFAGYLGQPARAPDAPLRTGDLGRLVRHGGREVLVLMGRHKDMILRRGVNLYPGTLEPPVLALRDGGGPLVSDCALIGVWNDAREDEDVVLFARPAPGRDAAAVQRTLSARLPALLGPDGAPDRVEVLDDLPVTGRQNKLDREALRGLARSAGVAGGRRWGAGGRRWGAGGRRWGAGGAGAGLAGGAGAGLVGGRRAGDAGAAAPVRAPGAVMPFGWRAFAAKHAVLLREQRAPREVAGQLAFRLGLWTLAQGSWALDAARGVGAAAQGAGTAAHAHANAHANAHAHAHANAHAAPAKPGGNHLGPLFVLGHQRSGTTFLQRLLARDETHARALALHEMLLPAQSAQGALDALGRLDDRLGGRLRAALDRWQAANFGPLDDLHRLRFEEVEEDELILWALYASATCVNDAPVSAESRALDGLRRFERWSPARRAEVLGWYRACLQNKLEREPAPGDEPTWIVSKNPAFTQKIPWLLQAFPDARFVYLVRDPREAIPSRLSLIQAIWRRRFPGFERMTAAQVDTLLADSVATYLAAEQDLPRLPDDRHLVVRYEALTTDPAATVGRIYARLGLPGPDAALGRALAGLQAVPHVSRHRYDLGAFGLTEGRLVEALAPVFERYGWGVAGTAGGTRAG